MAGDERVRAVAELLASASELIHNSGYTEDVTPAQWAALRYFSTANPTAADLMSYARHHGTTKGTASRTVTRLEDKGLLERRRVAGDLRRPRPVPCDCTLRPAVDHALAGRLPLLGRLRGCEARPELTLFDFIEPSLARHREAARMGAQP